jgi:antitoxin (DNA-binding transcriptional repressor) of toxin-antitoxin stability system
VDEAAAGEDIVIARAGKPVVRLVAVASLEGPRQLGVLAGKIIERDDAWAADAEIEAAFYGGDIEPLVQGRVAERLPKLRNASRRKK